ncbi:MAG: LLM class flavin-dependent oxidoreductase [Candidatus Methanofastidiosia archaeon]|jgi:alkanesulfonate monooxygenase SsuD/methylene tetrahydromethanopterin reductase-like flavin-dependent oxidoreductase (luciferase family)
MHTIQFGVILLQSEPWEPLVHHGKEIEKLGFDSLWVADHFCNYGQPKQPWFEGWTTLTGLTSATDTIRIGTLVTSISLRHPAVLARQALTVDHISHGRLTIGIGGGAPSSEGEIVYDMIGIEDWSPAERVAHFKEYIEIVDGLLRKQVLSYPGKYYHLKEAALYPPPVQEPRPPITIGCIRPKMLKIAAQYADTWNTFGGINLNPEEMFASIKTQYELVDTYCKEVGRNPSTLKRSILVFGEEVFTLYDSEDRFMEYIEKYREIGFSEFIVYYPFKEEQIPIFKKIAKEIIPDLKS